MMQVMGQNISDIERRCAAGGNLYHELRQGKLMLMPSFTSGFQKMLKWLMASAPGAHLCYHALIIMLPKIQHLDTRD